MEGQDVKRPEYTVRPRKDCFAVMRQGPKGGFRFITAYEMEHQANDVAAKLNQWAGTEK